MQEVVQDKFFRILNGPVFGVNVSTLTATNLKPNFTYQLKLVGISGTRVMNGLGLRADGGRRNGTARKETWAFRQLSDRILGPPVD